jgi:hypothetical protein
MTRNPVTLADQGIFLDADDAGELADLLADAAWVIGHLASLPAAEHASATAPCGPCTCSDLAGDLKLAGLAVEDAAIAGNDNTYLTLLGRTAPAGTGTGTGTGQNDTQHAAEKQHSAEGRR